MKLTKVRIREFQSVQDSNEFDVGDITCLVGKNESGKTALLKALYRLNPIETIDSKFDVTDDYPRGAANDYRDDVEGGRRSHSDVVQATFTLEPDDVEAVEEAFGPQCFKEGEPQVILLKGYANQIRYTGLEIDRTRALAHLVEAAGLPVDVMNELLKSDQVTDMLSALDSAERTESVQNLTSVLQQIEDNGLCHFIYYEILSERVPKFLYFNEYYQMKGQDNLDSLRQRVANNTLEGSDFPLLGLIELARLDLDQLDNPGRTEALFSNIESAANSLSQRVLKHWSQNKHLRMRIDVRPAQPNDPVGMQSGTNIWGRIEDTRQYVTTSFGSRSRGFVWFFSFLAWYSRIRRGGENIILLLDEPGLSLHGKAQGDLLRYFEEELKPHHQIIYTTHSPFMVDPNRFDRTRIVQDLSIEREYGQLSDEDRGTKVITDVLEATPDSLFPMQGALGYELHQTLFIGPNCLIVEGASDLLYIQAMSAMLQRKGEEGLRSDWTITPVGGISNVSTLVALIGAQGNLNVAVLVDYEKSNHQYIENLYKRKLLQQKKVLTFADFTTLAEADIEDVFNPDFYLKLVNAEYGTEIELNDLPQGGTRILGRVEHHLKDHSFANDAKFNHYRPARYFTENAGTLESELDDITIDGFRKIFNRLNSLL